MRSLRWGLLIVLFFGFATWATAKQYTGSSVVTCQNVTDRLSAERGDYVITCNAQILRMRRGTIWSEEFRTLTFQEVARLYQDRPFVCTWTHVRIETWYGYVRMRDVYRDCHQMPAPPLRKGTFA